MNRVVKLKIKSTQSIFFMRTFLLLLLFSAVLHSTVLCQDLYDEEDDYEDPLSVGGGTQQTCDACRTVMDQLLQEWHTIDNTSFLEAIEEASHKKEYVPVIPEEEVGGFVVYCLGDFLERA